MFELIRSNPYRPFYYKFPPPHHLNPLDGMADKLYKVVKARLYHKLKIRIYNTPTAHPTPF